MIWSLLLSLWFKSPDFHTACLSEPEAMFMYKCMSMSTCTWMCACLYVCMYVCVCLFVCMYVYMYVCLYMYMKVNNATYVAPFTRYDCRILLFVLEFVLSQRHNSCLQFTHLCGNTPRRLQWGNWIHQNNYDNRIVQVRPCTRGFLRVLCGFIKASVSFISLPFGFDR